MFTNELKKGDKVRLRNGWNAVIMDNKKGNTRLAEVHGIVTEIGSVYAHDIVFKFNADSTGTKIEHTEAQKQLRERCGRIGF